MGKLEAIWIKRAKRGPMDSSPTAELVTAKGIAGNANQGGKRQVTIIAREVFDQLSEELGTPIDPSWRRANLLISGIDLAESRHHTLRIGDASIRIWGETRPCEQMDEALPGLRSALGPPWLGGAFGAVIEGGPIRVGDSISLEPPEGA